MKFCLTAVPVRLKAKVPKLVLSIPPKWPLSIISFPY